MYVHHRVESCLFSQYSVIVRCFRISTRSCLNDLVSYYFKFNLLLFLVFFLAFISLIILHYFIELSISRHIDTSISFIKLINDINVIYHVYNKPYDTVVNVELFID